MTLRLFFLIVVLCLLPQSSFAVVSTRTLEIEISFDAAAVLNKTLDSYKLYEDGKPTPVCNESNWTVTSATTHTIKCEITTEDAQHYYELVAHYSDGTDSPKSPKLFFTTGDTGDTGDVVGTPPPIVGAPPPETAGAQLISYSWETSATSSTISGYRMYMNETALCETSDPAATSLSCYADLINEPMAFSIVSFDAAGTESAKSNLLTLDPANFPELFQKKATTFTWEYTDAASSAGGFQVFSNDSLLCQTSDPNARSLQCVIDILLPQHTFTLAAVSSTGALTAFSNSIIYSSSDVTTTPPTTELKAVITSSTVSGPTPLAVSFSAGSSTGDIKSYSWSFGDGDMGTASVVTHTYSIPGTYSANLEVVDSTGKTALASLTIKAEETVIQYVPPTAVIATSSAAGEAPLTVSFDGSASTAINSTVVSYAWDFGDGAKGSGKTISHVYTIAGTYNTQLLVTDSLGLTDTENTPVIVTPATKVNQLPVAAFSVSPAQGPSPFTASFDASSAQDPDGTIANYVWNFGDGLKGSGKTVQHTYTTVATYTATLQVTDDLGATSQTVSKTIVAEKPQPEITLNYEIGELALTHEWVRVNFDNSFTNPAVFVSPPTNNDKEAVLTRVRNLDKSGFDIRLQEWDYLDGKHLQETVSFLVLEQGQTILPDGTMLEVGRFNGSTKNQTVTFKQAFSASPVVLTTVVSVNEADAVIGRISGVTAKTFTYKLQEQELTPTKHGNESVAYLAWSQGSGDVDNIHFSTAVPTKTVTNTLTTVPFNEAFQALPFLFIEQQTINGGDPAALRLQKLTTDNVELFVQEEQSKDSEINHAAETTGYLGITATEQQEQITFTWDFNSSQESSITGFRIYNNGLLICETTTPGIRVITCTTATNSPNSFSVRAVENTGLETLDSNIINYIK